MCLLPAQSNTHAYLKKINDQKILQCFCLWYCCPRLFGSGVKREANPPCHSPCLRLWDVAAVSYVLLPIILEILEEKERSNWFMIKQAHQLCIWRGPLEFRGTNVYKEKPNVCLYMYVHASRHWNVSVSIQWCLHVLGEPTRNPAFTRILKELF